MLAKIALARHDADTARDEAKLAQEEDPTLPLPLYIEARLLPTRPNAPTLPLFEQAITALEEA